VRVFVRVRPAVRKNELEAAEGDKGSTSAIHCQGAKLWLLEDGGGGEKSEKKGGTRQFVFDGSLTPDSTQVHPRTPRTLTAHLTRTPPFTPHTSPLTSMLVAGGRVPHVLRRDGRGKRRARGHQRLRHVLRPDGRRQDAHARQRGQRL
jgi:hypothetical protein